MILQSSAQIFHNGGDTRERGKQITRSLVFHSWCFVPLRRGCQQPDRRSLRVGSWVQIKAGTKSLNAATLQPFKLLPPPPPETQNKSLHASGSVLFTHMLHVSPASSSPSSISPLSPGTQQTPTSSQHREHLLA